MVTWGVSSAFAETPTRQTTITVAYTEYEWWLLEWQDNDRVCTLLLDHEGLPTLEDVTTLCGYEVYQYWQATPPCENKVDSYKAKDTYTCEGVYLFFVSSQPKEKEVIVNLPLITAQLSLDGCTLIPPENRCTILPTLVISSTEPLPNESITSVEGTFDGLAFSCPGNICAIPLQTTGPEGIIIDFWIISSFGDESERFTAKVRVIDTGVTSTPDSGGWFVDVLSSQWVDGEPASCSENWDTFPPVGGPPSWLSTPENSGLIASDQAYYYLAGRLISQGIVEADSCPSGGLLPNGYANACGLEIAKPLVEEWQNKFDAKIIEISQQSGVPAQLLKNIFAQESQFWPGIFKVPYEFGLGQITDNGADTILLWNENFYNQFCPLILLQEACDEGYLHLTIEDQAILRGALAVQAKSDCDSCVTGLDLTNVNFSISLFADTLKANCDQVAQIVYNATNEMPGIVTSYEDLWRFTIANYHIGPGCLSYAIYMAWSETGEITWETVSEKLTEPCQGVIPYVNKIAQ